jgi:5-methyltetrahydropteroyltriglutamate--homocysteine methyltransferase
MTLFPASVVGSLPRPAWVRDLVFGADVDPELRRTRLDAAIAAVVALQEQAGLDVVTDGEWRRRSYIGVIAELAHGFSLSIGSDGRPLTMVTGELAPKQPGFVADEARFVRTLTKRGVKATLPAPALLGERLWDPEGSRRRTRSARTSCARPCRSCVGSSSCSSKPASTSCRSTTRTSASSWIPKCGASTPTSTRR